MDWSIVTRLGIALAIGLIIGAERGWQNQQDAAQNSTNTHPASPRPPGATTAAAGIRSFGFVGLLGGLSMLLALANPAAMPVVLATLFFGYSIMVAVSYWLTAQATGDLGMTTEISLLLTFCLGALAVGGYKGEAIAAAVVIAVILGLKEEFHRSLSKLSRTELQATLQLLLIGIVALPLLPDQALGPWNAINPRTIGWLVVLIAATSYAGYFAVTISFAQMSKKRQGSPMLLGAGISLAAGTMAVRLLIEISIVNAALLPWLIPPIAALALVPLIAAVITHQQLARRDQATSAATPTVHSTVKLKNPLELKSALFYGGLFTLLFVLVQAAEAWLGDTGIYLLSGLSGITDVDAVSLSLAAAAKGSLSPRVAILGIMLAVTVNTLVKAGIAVSIGGKQLARWSASILLASLGVSYLTLWLLSGLPS